MSSQMLDQRGRPIVVVTGIGLVTSLGVGANACWRRLVAGHSGIKSIARFPTDGLRTTIAGTVDDFDVTPASAYDLSMAMAEAMTPEPV